MLSNQPASTLRPLCYEHHKEMRLVEMLWGTVGSPFRYLSTCAKYPVVLCATPADMDTSLRLTTGLDLKKRYCLACAVHTMEHPCISGKSAPERGASACGDARDARRRPGQELPPPRTRLRAPQRPQKGFFRLVFVVPEDSCISEPHSEFPLWQLLTVNHPAMKMNFTRKMNF